MSESVHPYVAIARGAIAAELGLRTHVPPTFDDIDLHRRGSSFVRLSIDGQLRGSLGTVRPFRSLAADIAENAVNSAFHDPRFAPITRDEFERIAIEVAIVTNIEPLTVHSQLELFDHLRPNIDGLLLERGSKHASFMPTAWRTAPTKAAFVSGLLRKAGRPGNFWADDIRATRFQTRIYGDPIRPAKELVGSVAN